MNKREKAKKIMDLLCEYYPDNDKCYLNYKTPWQLLIATILSAQCTDDRVNIVTSVLFEKYPSVDAFADAPLPMLENDVKPTGFYRNKARNIIMSMRLLRDSYAYEMPRDIDVLVKFPGVGRKTANVVLGHIYGIPGVVVDTHVKRVSGRLGLTSNTDPEKIEIDLMKVLPKKHWIRYNTQIIAHGRAVCTARSPKCAVCFLADLCSHKPASIG